MTPFRRNTSVSILFFLAIAACSSDEDASDGSGGSGGSSTAECAKDTDCSGDLVCLGGRCVADPGVVPDSGTTMPECATDVDCENGGTCSPEGTCALRPGNCTSAADEMAVGADYPAPDGGVQQARDLARTCGIDCLVSSMTEDDIRPCTETCIVDEVGISAGCATCLADSVDCGRMHCLSQCLSDDETECFRCTCGENSLGVDCISLYEECSGLASTTCDPFGG